MANYIAIRESGRLYIKDDKTGELVKELTLRDIANLDVDDMDILIAIYRALSEIGTAIHGIPAPGASGDFEGIRDQIDDLINSMDHITDVDFEDIKMLITSTNNAIVHLESSITGNTPTQPVNDKIITSLSDVKIGDDLSGLTMYFNPLPIDFIGTSNNDRYSIVCSSFSFNMDIGSNTSIEINNGGGVVPVYNNGTWLQESYTFPLNSIVTFVGDPVNTGNNITLTDYSISSWNPLMISFVQKSPEMVYHETKDYGWMNSIYTSLTARLDSIQNSINVLVAITQNKVPDTNNALDIEAMAGETTGWTVPSGLGGMITGKGGSYLLVGTGVVWINGIEPPAYNNRGIPLAIGAPAMNVVVQPGDIITQNNMIELIYIPYKSA